MSWVKLDDGFFDNPTNRSLGSAGRDLYIAGLCFCAKSLTDGRIAKTDVALVVALAQTKPATVKKLVTAGRWLDRGDHYEVDQYLKYNPSREHTEERRSEISRKKSEAGKKGARARWHPDSTSNGTADDIEHGKPDGKPNGPVPSRPHDSLSSSNNTEGLEPPANPDDPVLELLAERRADLEHPGGQGIGNRPAYLAAVRSSYTNRADDLAALRQQHPGWTTEQLADELDPDTAPRVGNVATVEETDVWLAHLDEARAAATPMPDEIRKAARR